MPENTTQQIEIKRIRPPDFNSRVDLTSAAAREELNELAQSMRRPDGTPNQLQPIIVELMPDGNYKMIAGFRRFQAAILNKWETISATVRPETDAVTRIVDNGLENLRRRNLSPYEEGRLYSTVRSTGLTAAKVGAMFGVSGQKVGNLAVTYEKLAPEVRDEWERKHPAATVDFLRELCQRPAQQQVRDWNARVELLKVADDVLANEVPDEDPEEPARTEGGGVPEKRRSVEIAHYRAVLRALQKKKIAGQVLAIQAVKLVMGDLDKIAGVFEPEARS